MPGEIDEAIAAYLKVANGEFISAVDRVSTIATERGRVVKLSLSNSNLVLSVNNPDGGSATEELGVTYNPLSRQWKVSRDMDVNYMLAASRSGGE